MTESLPEDKHAEYKDAFNLFDKDQDGKITGDELAEVMRSLGQTPNDEDINAMIKDVDADGNGTIEFDEFVAVMEKHQGPEETTEEDILAVFKAFDKDNDGFITPDELLKALTDLGEKDMTKEQVDEMIKEADITGDGKVNYEEFERCYNFGKNKVKSMKEKQPGQPSEHPSQREGSLKNKSKGLFAKVISRTMKAFKKKKQAH